MGILSVDLNNISLDDSLHIRFLPRHITFEKCKAIKKV